MDRRKFLSLASFAGVSVAPLDAFGPPARPGSRAGLTPLAATHHADSWGQIGERHNVGRLPSFCCHREFPTRAALCTRLANQC